jgi:uncharacterized membrane protein (DUF2068 family)
MDQANFRPPRAGPLSGRLVVTLIGIFKLIKAALLVLASVAALELTRPMVRQLLGDWCNDLDIGPYRSLIGDGITRHVLGLNVQTLIAVAVGAALYATLFFTEGMGLLFDKLWAEWITVISTAGLIPMELVEFYHRPGFWIILALAINIAIVIYLARRVRCRMRLRRQHQPQRNSTGI